MSAERINEIARILMAEWERVEGKPVNASYVATFADMARAVIASGYLPEPVETVEWGVLNEPETDQPYWFSGDKFDDPEAAARYSADDQGWTLVRRVRRSWPDQVGEWEPVEEARGEPLHRPVPRGRR